MPPMQRVHLDRSGTDTKEDFKMANPKAKSTPEAEVVAIAPAPAEQASAVIADVEPVIVIEGQLNIYENRVITVPAGVKLTVVENLGEGYLYADNTDIQYTSKYQLAPGEKKEYEGATNLFLSSASRPNFRISFYK